MSFTVASKPVGRIGYGMGGLTFPTKALPTPEAIRMLKSALSAGANMWNAGEHYGTPDYNSLHLLHAYFTQYPEDADNVFISVKSCLDTVARKPSNDAKSVRESIERCLGILDGKCKIDIFQPCRLDPDVPTEETIRAINEYVQAGKIGSIGLSEVSAASVRKAAAVAPIAAVEIELSLFETSVLSNGVAEACAELRIPLVAYSPINRGFLSGQIRKFEDMPEKDYRRLFPRYQEENFGHNMQLVEEVEKIAKRKDCSPVQVGLAWVCAQSEAIGVPVIPIPGSSSLKRLEENMSSVTLSADEMREIQTIVSSFEVKGDRAPPQLTKYMSV